MLTVAPPHWSDEERALMAVARWWQRLRWTKTRSLLAVVAALHLVGAWTLVFAPDNQLFTQGTRPVFALFPPAVWAVAFLIGGLGAASLLWRFTGPRQLITWFTVLPSQTMWIGASVIAVAHGGGSAMGVVFLPAVLAFTVITAVVVAFDFTSGKR